MSRILLLILVALIGVNFTTPAYAENTQVQEQTAQNAEYKQVNLLLNNLIKSSNEHNTEEINRIYATNYISGDGLKREDLFKIMKDSWDSYPDIKYSSEIKNIRINNNLAMIETYDKAISSLAKKSPITGDTGILDSTAHNILYLQKFGKGWKIITDKVLYESTIIKYGSAKNINIRFSAPEQVYAGENYTASLYTDIPANSIAFATINTEPIVYPQVKTEEIFRQISPEIGTLERFVKANSTNNNELASASVGYTEISGTNPRSPDIKLSGLAVVLQRVNVIPRSSYIVVNNESQDKSISEPDEDILPDNTINGEDIEIDE